MAASAQEPVQVDPDSPAGVEYKLPLEQARRDSAPDPGDGGGRPRSGGGSGRGAGSPAPLFGAGITRGGSQGGSDGDAEGAPGEGDRVGGERSDRVGGERSDRVGGEQSEDRADAGVTGAGGRDTAGPGSGKSGSFSTAAAEDGGGSTGLILGGIALAVVVLGGALGLALRRGLGSTAGS
jgi:hypothetical protein